MRRNLTDYSAFLKRKRIAGQEASATVEECVGNGPDIQKIDLADLTDAFENQWLAILRIFPFQ
ncbi:MAG: hypothetical protein K0B01_05670 [Syntrophobacterales bacterium]|nr:hypothetical protein [Syntrophobacterales bacterium]